MMTASPNDARFANDVCFTAHWGKHRIIAERSGEICQHLHDPLIPFIKKSRLALFLLSHLLILMKRCDIMIHDEYAGGFI